MKLFNFDQKEPVAFVGDGVLLCESRIRFSLLEVEKQVNKLHDREIIPTSFSIRNLTLFDVLFHKKHIKKEGKYLVFTRPSGHRNYQAVYNRNGSFLCFHLTLRAPIRLCETTEAQPQAAWVSYEWIIDSKGNRLLKIDYQKLSGSVRRFYLLSREFVSIKESTITHRKISYTGPTAQKIETHLYSDGGKWIPVSDQHFPADHWKQTDEICSEFS